MKKYIEPKRNSYSLIEFQSMYGNETACEKALYTLKWPNGYECPRCHCTSCSVIHGRRLPLYQCSVCRLQSTVTTGTIMENTKLPLVKWFLAAYFFSINKDGISEVALAKYIGVTLKTAWAVLYKLRNAAKEREALYKLCGSVEMDEAFFGGKRTGKRGRGSENKTQVAVALQLDKAGHPEYLKMQVIPDAAGETLLAFAQQNITVGATIHSDAFRSYNTLSGKYDVRMEKYDSEDASGHLKWLHVMISNIKANIEGAYHGLDGTYLQRYLDEFCYRFNRRWSMKPIMLHLLECMVWAPYKTVAECRI